MGSGPGALEAVRRGGETNSPYISYVIHIAATPEDLWEAITSPRALELNWGKIRSEWTVGSEVTEVSKSGDVLWKGAVLRSDAPRLLSYTFDVTGSGEAASEVAFTIGVRRQRLLRAPRLCGSRLPTRALGTTVSCSLVARGPGRRY
jgi:uncharacterized protein YndB with AHSA1/START domain